jgi:hypothetical protein
MRNRLSLISLALSLLVLYVFSPSIPAHAQSPASPANVAKQRPADLQPLPEPPPMAAGLSDDPFAGVEPEITIKRRGDDKIEEFRANGKLYKIKVTPPFGYPYVLVDTDGDGTFTPYDAHQSELRVPQWQIFNW